MRKLEEKCKQCIRSTCECNNALHSTDSLKTCYGCPKDANKCKPIKKKNVCMLLKTNRQSKLTKLIFNI